MAYLACGRLEPRFDAIVQQLLDEGKGQVVFDLSRATYMTSPGVACTIKALNRLRAVDGRLQIDGATADMLELLRLTRLGEYVKVV